MNERLCKIKFEFIHFMRLKLMILLTDHQHLLRYSFKQKNIFTLTLQVFEKRTVNWLINQLLKCKLTKILFKNIF